MEKQEMITKTEEALRPFETQNLISTLQNLTLTEIFTNPVVLIVMLSLLFLGIYKKSKVVLLTLFLLIGMIIIMRYALPAPGEELTMKSILPFIGIGLGIGGIIVYFSFVKD
jgi:hypothetical protein